MPNLLGRGQRWLADMQARHVSVRVQYARAGANVCMSATPGRSEWDVADASGALFRVETRDYLIKRELLELDSVPIEPQAGDRIIEGDYTYEVSAPAPNVAVWHWDGPHRVRYRIHTKLITQPT